MVLSLQAIRRGEAYEENYLGLGKLEAEFGQVINVKTSWIWIPGPPYWWVMNPVTNGTFTITIKNSAGANVFTVTGQHGSPDGVYIAKIDTGKLSIGTYTYQATVSFTRADQPVIYTHEDELAVTTPSLWIIIPGVVTVIAIAVFGYAGFTRFIRRRKGST
jgi:hypothetical protein